MTAPDTSVAPHAPDTVRRLRELNEKFTDVGAAERANYQIYLMKLCEAIGVEEPRPAAVGGRVAEHTAYQFEFPVQTTTRDGVVSTNFIDLFKTGCFALEAKHSAEGASATTLLTKAFGQVSNYARDLADRPPYIMVLDVGRTLIIWDRWQGTYGGFHLGHRIDLRTLADHPEHVALLRDIWNDPGRRDPRRHAQQITVGIAGLLAELSATLEARGHDAERVARFLIRCVFSMFAEDVKLLPNKAFTRLLDAVMTEPPERFVEAAEDLWTAMDGGTRFGYDRILRFNGHFFASAEALPLQKSELALLRRAAEADWSAVEPSIFGTLLVRALTPEERHRLGAEYTPRAFIERLVRPTVEEPVRERWAAVQAEVMQLREQYPLPETASNRGAKDAQKRAKNANEKVAEIRAIWSAPLFAFHAWLRSLRILDPACGSGNFLYVTMHALKRVEVEVFRLLAEVQGDQISTRMDEIDPGQFFGIEVKAWAREIAELTLWIGFHQFWKQQHGDVQPMEPLLRDTGTIECRDAVLAWDTKVHRPERDRPDPTPRIVHPVTGQLVPDPARKLAYYEYVGARQAEWPEADFIVGNPPYQGGNTMRGAFGDGYVDALRALYPLLGDGVDFVAYWVSKATENISSGIAERAGLITTNSIVQVRNRRVFEQAFRAGVRPVWAIKDHPWEDGSDAAAVRVAMFVLAPAHQAIRAELVAVDEQSRVVLVRVSGALNADLTVDADVASAAKVPLRANFGIASNGFYLRGAGFILDKNSAGVIVRADERNRDVVKAYFGGIDLARRMREMFVIDFATMSEENAASYPLPFDWVRDRVLPERLGKAEESARTFWWQFWRPRPSLRTALAGTFRFFATPYVAKHRFFIPFDSQVRPDDKVVCIALDAFIHLAVVSSRIHTTWALAAGGRLGVGNDPSYNVSLCFECFPFPTADVATVARIAAVAERLDAHRKSAIARDERVTMTGMYNVVAKLRSGEPLTPKERTTHELAACGVLRDIHDELDDLVAQAYGWPWPMSDSEILERLVALHDERVEEEKRGIIRWLRPEFQAPGQAVAAPPSDLGLQDAVSARAPVIEALTPWPVGAVDQIGALKRLASAGAVTVDEAVARFSGARREIVARHLETLAILGELRDSGSGSYGAAAAA